MDMDKTQDYACEVKERAAQPALAVRVRTPVQGLPQVMGDALGAVMAYLGELGEHPAGPPYTAYYNMDMQDLDVEIGFPLARPQPSRGRVQACTLPAGKVATLLYVGPYGEIGKGYQALTQWIDAHGYVPTGVAYETYLNDPSVTPPEALQTQISYPLK